MKKSLYGVKIFFSLFLTGLFIYLLLRGINFREVIKNFLNVNWFFIILSIVFGILLFFVKVFRWKTILSYKKNIKFKDLLEVLTISQMITTVVPFRAGDVVQIFYLNIKEKVDKTTILSSIVLYQVLDLFSMFLVFILVSFFIAFPLDKNYIILPFGVIIVIVFFYFILREKIINFISKYSAYLAEKILLFNEGVKNFFNLRLFVKIICMTILMWLLGYLNSYYFFKGFGIKITLLGILSFLSIPSMVNVIPLTPGFWGTWDFVAVSVLRIFGVEKELALSCVLTMHFVSTCQIALLGGIFMLKTGVKR